MANLVLPKFGPRIIKVYCRTILVLGPFFCLQKMVLPGPTLGLIFAARNGPRTIPYILQKSPIIVYPQIVNISIDTVATLHDTQFSYTVVGIW